MSRAWRPSRSIVATWIGLMWLLATTIVVAYQPLGAFNGPAAVAIAAIKSVLVAIFFMGLRRKAGIVLLAAGMGVFWLGILLWLGLMDFVTRGT